MKMKEVIYNLYHFFLGNYCDKCKRCAYWYKNPYDGMDSCTYPRTHNQEPDLVKVQYNHIIDCNSFEEKAK